MTSVDLLGIVKHAEKLGMQQRVEELVAMAGILIASRPKNILEIGVYGGGSFSVWCALASGRKIGIDSGSLAGPIHNRMDEFRANFGDVYLIRGDSHAEATFKQTEALLQGEKLDFLFIDGDHTLEGVKADFETYSKLVCFGGWIAFHDTTASDYHRQMNAGGSAQHWDSLVADRKIYLDWADPGFGIGAIQKCW